MTNAERSDAPIYASLVEKHGDVLTEARRYAEQANREVSAMLDFSRTQSLSGGPAARGGPRAPR
jgi:hypothetical protein